MTLKEALLDTAYNLEQLSHRPCFHGMASGRVLLAEVKRLTRIAEQVEDKEYTNEPTEAAI
jgi:hypothetical protein